MPRGGSAAQARLGVRELRAPIEFGNLLSIRARGLGTANGGKPQPEFGNTQVPGARRSDLGARGTSER
eukprot:14950995-Alexandrium_andersonii.AAC.1